MALEAAVSSQDLLGNGFKDFCSSQPPFFFSDAGYFKAEDEKDQKLYAELADSPSPSSIQHDSTPEACTHLSMAARTAAVSSSPADSKLGLGLGLDRGRRKRRRTRSFKNREEAENQRQTHIVVERNRRKQMNEYLAVLRSLMPASYAHKGDQASIVGGAINFVKKLQQLLQSLEARKRMARESDDSSSLPFANFFASPQYSCWTNNEAAPLDENQSAVAMIEVSIAESHASLKLLLRRRPKHLLRMVTGLNDLHLAILHLNVTSIGEMSLYTISVKVEDDSGLKTVDEIAAAVKGMLDRISQQDPSEN